MRPWTAFTALLIVAARPAMSGLAETPDPVAPAQASTEVAPADPAIPTSTRHGMKPVPRQQATASPSPTENEPRLSEDDIRELDVIRRQLRISPLLGPAWAEKSSATSTNGSSDFASQLRRRYGQAAQQEPSAGALPVERGTDQATIFRQRSIRSLSRRLDAIAQDMEELRLYDEADRVRELSQAMRDQARP